MRVRIEKDSLGEKELPQEAYYGITSLRDHDNVQIFKKGIKLLYTTLSFKIVKSFKSVPRFPSL